MPNQCPLCGQALPKGVHEHELKARLKKLSSPVLTAERKKIREEYEAQLVAERRIAKQKAEGQVQRELRDAKARAGRAEQDKQKLRKDYEQRLEKERIHARQGAERDVRREFEERLRKEVAKNVRLSTQQSESKLDKLQSERERDRVRYEAKTAKLQGQLENLSRKLEGQSGERLGTEAELDLLSELRRAFPEDKIEPIGRGVKGADIVQRVVDGTKIAGQIIYESKNTLEWNNGFIAQAKKYQTQYDTPYVMIVTRAFPSKRKGFCIEKGIPVVEKSMAVSLATVIREGVIEIAKLRLSDSARDERSKELFDYVVGDRFVTRFRDIAEGVNSLRSQQQKEKTWHENTWETESKIHERIEGCHREVGAQIRAIVGGTSNGKAMKLAAKA